jgi:A/G-specific adenine glycosylase
MSARRSNPQDEAVAPTAEEIAEFRDRVLTLHAENGRSMPWRETHDAYAILVSEVMLQQTQVPRVLPAYERFLAAFPDADALAAAPLEAVLREWQGLGYNRRAVRLKQAAETISADHAGEVPQDFDALVALPGIGPTTAAGVMAFAFGESHVYIETNVRAALLHDFFAAEDDVPDSRLVPVFEAVMDRDDPRTWLYALMDYGAHLKRTVPNPSRRSRHYAAQSPFEGSRRQKRSRLLRAVMDGATSPDELAASLDLEFVEVEEILSELAEEGFLVAEDGRYTVA